MSDVAAILLGTLIGTSAVVVILVLAVFTAEMVAYWRGK